jgi:hypothetical protein
MEFGVFRVEWDGGGLRLKSDVREASELPRLKPWVNAFLFMEFGVFRVEWDGGGLRLKSDVRKASEFPKLRP